MPISFSCSCGKKFQVKDDAAGKRAKCLACGNVLVVPPSTMPEADDIEPPTVTEKAAPPPPPSKARPEPPAPSFPRTTAPSPPRSTVSLEKYRHILNKKEDSSFQEYSYWLLLLFLIPLGVSLTSTQETDFGERFARSLAKAPLQTRQRIQDIQDRFLDRLLKASRGNEDVDLDNLKPPTDELLMALPNARLEDAHLSRTSFLHWLYGLGAAILFLVVTLFLFPEIDRPLRILLLGLFTATIGIVLLFVVQWLARWTQGYIFISRNIILLILFWVAWAIGFSYRAAVDPSIGLVPSFLGYTFGVGFCEEVCKALPIIAAYRADSGTTWRRACALGFASGVGFGISEGIMYASDFYNGIAPFGTYMVRFLSCVALHGIWSAAVALFVHKHQVMIQGELALLDYIPRLVFLVSIPMILHGLYDTFLKRDLPAAALITALISFGWLAWCIEGARKEDRVALATT